MISASSFRSARMRVMRKVLVPLGFVERGRIYVRQIGCQIHGLEFQAAQMGGSFAVNLAFHYDFLPSLMTLKQKPFPDYELLDFLIFARLGQLVWGYDMWWPYGSDLADCKEQLSIVGLEGARVLDRLAAQWTDGSWFIEHITPDMLAASRRSAVNKSNRTKSPVRLWDLLPEWETSVIRISHLLCFLAIRQQNYSLAIEYADVGLSETKYAYERPVLQELRRQAEAAQ